MSGFMPHTAMLLAAGFGQRMMPLTADRPKPMLLVAGKPMIDHALDKLVAAGVQRAVINLHYKGEIIRAHLQNRRDIEIIFSPEAEALETGGGVKQALPMLGDQPIFCINTDLVWTDNAAQPALAAMAATWDATQMDVLLLLKPLATAVGFEPDRGDYFMQPNASEGGLEGGPEGRKVAGKVYGRTLPPPRPYVFIGTQIVQPQLYTQIAAEKFSNLLIFDAAEAKGRLHGVVHAGGAYHAGTPADLAHVNALLGGA